MASPPIGTPASARSRRRPAARRRPIPRPKSTKKKKNRKKQHKKTTDHHVAMTLKGRDCIVQARPFLFRSYQSPLYFACTVPTSLSRLPADSVRCCEGDTVIFRHLFEPLSSTYTYLLGCEETRQAVLIDPVLMAVERDLAEISRLDLTLAYTLDSHIHADHVTAALELK